MQFPVVMHIGAFVFHGYWIGLALSSHAKAIYMLLLNARFLNKTLRTVPVS
jgi:hypothetical protein